MRLLFIFLSVLNVGIINSQEITCADRHKEITSLMIEKDYSNASIVLKEILKKCPADNEKNYLIGIEILQNDIDLSSDENREKTVKEFLKLLDQYDANFPNNKNGNLVKKAMTLYDNKIGEQQEVFVLLDKAFSKDKSQFVEANSIFTYFKLYYDQFLDKSKKISENNLLEKYNQVLSLIDETSKSFPEKNIDFRNATFAIKSILKNDLTPEKLVSFAESNFEKNKTNIAWLESTLKLLSEKSTSKAIFGQLATALHQLKPTSKSAYYLGDYNLKNKKIDEGVKYFDEAVNTTQDKLEKASIAYSLASILSNSDKSKAAQMVKLAIANDEKNGKYYIFLANLYANSAKECGSTSDQSNGVYKLASSTVLKAGEIEPRLKATAEQLSKKYLTSISNQKKKTVQIDCWINETVQF